MGANAGRKSKIFRPFTMKAGGKIYMEHILVIAEKPSVAISIAKVILLFEIAKVKAKTTN